MQVPDDVQQGQFFDSNNAYPEQGYENEIATVGWTEMNIALFRNRDIVTTVKFDPLEELCWAGSESGRVGAYDAHHQRFVQFWGHRSTILNIAPSMEGVCTTSAHGIAYHTRGGVPLAHYNTSFLDEHKISAAQMSFGSRPVLMVASNDQLFSFDLERSKVLAAGRVGEIECLAQGKRVICCGTASGELKVLDHRSLNVVRSTPTHNSLITDVAIQGDLAVTCGYSQMGDSYKLDQQIKVTDLRMDRMIPSIYFRSGAQCVDFLPNEQGSFAALGLKGELQMIDTNSRFQSGDIYKVGQGLPPAPRQMRCMDVSSTGTSIVVGDNTGCLYRWGLGHFATINGYSRETEYGDAFVTPGLYLSEQESTSLLPEYPAMNNDFRLSDWSQLSHHRHVMKILPAIDVSLIPDVETRSGLMTAKNPGGGFIKNHQGSTSIFRAAQKAAKKKATEKSGRTARSFTEFLSSPLRQTQNIKPEYARIKIKIPKHGINAINFSRWNKTTFNGLSNLLPNAYCNAVLQVLYFIPHLRIAMLNHLCLKESCLACELGFLFHMLGTGKTITVEARNFLRHFKQIPEVLALGLMDPIEPSADLMLAEQIQRFLRFLLEYLDHELRVGVIMETEEEKAEKARKDKHRQRHMSRKQIAELKAKEEAKKRAAAAKQGASIVEVVFGSSTVKNTLCDGDGRGGPHLTQTPGKCLSYQIQYPVSRRVMSFCEMLAQTFDLESRHRIWCSTCKTYQAVRLNKRMTSCPPVLVVHCNINTDAELKLWQTDVNSEVSSAAAKGLPRHTKKKLTALERARAEKELLEGHIDAKKKKPIDGAWVREKIWIRLVEGEAPVVSDTPLFGKNVHEYELSSVTAHVADPPDKNSALTTVNGEHLVAHVKMNDDIRGEEKAGWFVFNDFVIEQSSAGEVTNMSYPWKQPCIMTFTRLNDQPPLPTRTYPVAPFALQSTPNLSKRSVHYRPSFMALGPKDDIKKGSMVAIDCEFVTTQVEEKAVNEQGESVIIVPRRQILARVSVVRGAEKPPFVPFIDDYIHTDSNQIVDYQTRHSGLTEGDLDPIKSSHHLTTLKASYIRLRSLLDLGVIFVGHGLKNDFTMINMVVPREQIIDTAELFQLKNKRMLSLRFLSVHLLKENIQKEVHDSIEDACAAMSLYRKYEELKRTNQFDRVLEDLAIIGLQTNWKV